MSMMDVKRTCRGFLSHTVDVRSGIGEMEQRHVKEKMFFVPLLLSHDQIFVTFPCISMEMFKSQAFPWAMKKQSWNRNCSKSWSPMSRYWSLIVKWSHSSEVDSWNSSCGTIPCRLMSFDCWPVGVSVWACVVTRWASRLSSHSWESRQGQWRIGQPFLLQVSTQMVDSAGPPGSLPPWCFVYLATLLYPNHYSRFLDRQNCKWRKMPWRHFRRQISGKVGERCAICGLYLERSDEQSWWYLRFIVSFHGEPRSYYELL